jgi:predicted sugar kinase
MDWKSVCSQEVGNMDLFEPNPKPERRPMTRHSLRTPSRLHFGLLSWGLNAPRQFGGVGLMVEAPGITITAESARSWTAEGPLAGRVLDFARKAAEGLRNTSV